ncbi:MAG: class I SAM-dependent methyltransferase [Anaerolineaceae bacterium]|nr:class I SAM-dependent methyltransferase [Anaerolineaceae bacterium]
MPVNNRDREEPVALSCYESMAEDYAAAVDTKPYNAFYERPAVLSLLPPLAGLNVLDAGCGSGWYAQYLLAQGAVVTAVDVSPKFVVMTKKRVDGRAEVRLADLGQPLDFAADASFDLILCPLVMHYLKDWGVVFAEFRRVLRDVGVLVFSTHHPFMDFQLFRTDSYFTTELLEDEWSTGKVRYYRRPLTAMTDALAATGFVVERILEPQPTKEFQRVDPEGYDRLFNNPWFLVIRARCET